MASFLLKLCLLCILLAHWTNAAVSMVKSDGSQTTTTSESVSTKSSKTKTKNVPKKKARKGPPRSQYNIMWVTPFQIFNVSTPDDFVVDPAMNEVLADYGQHLYSRFIEGIDDGTINLHGIDDKASLNDRFFALQQYLHETDNFHKSEAVPKQEFSTLLAQIKNVVKLYLQRCGVDKDVIARALSTISIDNNGGKSEEKEQQTTDPSERMFLWATMLGNGSYHAPHAHQDSIVSGAYFAKIPEGKDAGGHLVFGDPRGAGIYPFGLKYIHVPIEGQIVVFPGYLSHWVEPAKSSDWRVSFSFNIPGRWDDLSDTNMFQNF